MDMTEFLKWVENRNKVQCEDTLNGDVVHVKEEWEKFYASSSGDLSKIHEGLSRLEIALSPLVQKGFILIKFEYEELIKYLMEKLGEVARLADNFGGYTAVLSIPQASLHNPYYYFGAYALKKNRIGALQILIWHPVPIDQRHNYGPLLAMHEIFYSQVLSGANKAFDRLLSSYDQNPFVSENFEKKEEFINLICQFSFILCYVAVIQDESMYANFGRFYSERLLSLIGRLKVGDEYAKSFTEMIFREDYNKFVSDFDKRLAQIKSKAFGHDYFWESIEGWGKP